MLSLPVYPKNEHPQARNLKTLFYASALLLCCLINGGCQSNSCTLEPCITYSPPPCLIEHLPSPFPKITPEERSQDWAKELLIGRSLAREMDLYRAITCFKRAHFLIPKKFEERRREIEYEIFLAYYLGNKYEEAINTFEGSLLNSAPENFPALRDLLIALYDAYAQLGRDEKVCYILNILHSIDAEAANNLSLGQAIQEGNLALISESVETHPASENIYQFLIDYNNQSKSVKKAQILNAVLPGAGYHYVGQKKAALTSFLINALFIAAAYQLFERGYVPAGLIVSSLEFGWYFGGINGAGLAAKEYNERLYENLGREMLLQERLFPILMIQKGF
jgi:tetratricopeptide (TPR) repeat protein